MRLTLEDWYDLYESHHMTIADLLRLSNTTELIMFDRNWLDILNIKCDDENLTIRDYTPSEFFARAHKWIYTPAKIIDGARDINGNMKCHSMYDAFKHEWPSFDFHIEYKRNHWYPLTNGYLKCLGERNFGELEGLHWSAFPLTTKIGWRGPMIRRDAVF
jgi:hypothetical protein